MSSSITRVRKALADQIRSYVGDDVEVSWYAEGPTSYPRILIDEAFDSVGAYSVTYGASGGVTLNFTIVVEVQSRTDVETDTALMDEFLSWDSQRSIYAAVDADETLGGRVTQARVTGAERIQGDPRRAELPVVISLPKS